MCGAFWPSKPCEPMVPQVFTGHSGPVRCGRFTPDGKLVVTGGGEYDASLRVWDPKSGTCLKTMQGQQFHPVGMLLVSLASLNFLRHLFLGWSMPCPEFWAHICRAHCAGRPCRLHNCHHWSRRRLCLSDQHPVWPHSWQADRCRPWISMTRFLRSDTHWIALHSV